MVQQDAMLELIKALWVKLAPVVTVRAVVFDFPREIEKLLATEPGIRKLTAQVLAETIDDALKEAP